MKPFSLKVQKSSFRHEEFLKPQLEMDWNYAVFITSYENSTPWILKYSSSLQFEVSICQSLEAVWN